MRAFALLIALVVTSHASAAEPTCALLDPEKTPRAALLEAKLLAEPGAAWVERADIDKVLKEQKLQAAFGPQGVGERVRLGQLLKADLLVMIRPVKGAEQPAIEVVVSETASGLRLLLRAVPVTKNADEDVAALLAAAKDGIKRHAEKIDQVVAVPPFVSNDLGYQFDHLKAAYAKLAESIALDRKGVVVVELEEAQALAKELRLAAPGAVLRDRPPPIFLVGEYRNEGKAKDRTVFVKLRADRDGKPVGKPAAEIVKPDAVPDLIRKWAASVLDAAGGAAVALPDPKAEARRLAELGRVHRRLGNWQEALALIDASLLLDPRQLEVHADALEILPRWIDEIVRPNPRDLDRLRRGAELHRRGLEHLDALVTGGDRLPRHAPLTGPGTPRRQFASIVTRPFGPDRVPAVEEIIRPLQDEEAALYARLVVHVAKQGHTDEEVYYAVRAGVYRRSDAERYAVLEGVLLDLKNLPGARERMRAHLLHPFNLPRVRAMFAAHREFLDRLDATGNADIKAAVAEARETAAELERMENNLAMRLERTKVARAAFEAAKKADPKLGTPLSFSDPDRLDAALAATPFRHIRLTATPTEPDPAPTKEIVFPRLGQIRGIIPAGPGIDVLWADGAFSDGTLYVMKEKGKLRRVFRIGGLRSAFTSVVFDGKYVWAAGDSVGGRQPVMIVFDPKTERVVPVTERDGLPAGRKGPVVNREERVPGHRVAELGPGRVCVAGSFGQAWVAVATYDPAKGVAVKVIHEARDAEGDGPDEWKKTTVAFLPWHAFTLRGEPGADGKAPTRVLVSRLGRSQGMMEHPLLIDPDAPAAEVMQDRVPGLNNIYSSCGTGRSVYLAWGMGYQEGARKEPRLLRIDYPGKVRDLGPLPRSGGKPALHFDGQNLHVVRIAPELHTWEELVPVKERWWPPGDPSDWWVADADRKGVRKAAADFPRVFAVGTSSHYGLVVMLEFRTETALCTVTLDPPKKE
jgi:tetratricopeptide (TPR) repeat protein